MRIISLLSVILLLCCDSCTASGKPVQHPELTGPWLITITTRDAGRLQIVMNFEADEQVSADSLSFIAYTEKNMDRKILGTVKANLGRIAGSNFKNGSLIRISKGVVLYKDSIAGILVTPFGNYYFNTHLEQGRMQGVLSDGHHNTVGTVEGSHRVPALPLRHYPSITDSALKIAESKLYDPALLKTSDWLSFKKEIKRVSRVTGDDAAFVMAFFYYARKLPFSHFALYVPPPDDHSLLTPLDSDIVVSQKTSETCYMKINSFGGKAAAMDKAFDDIAAKNYKNLIVDLRGNPGGSIEAGLAFGRHILRDSLYIGVLLTQKYFNTHSALPQPADFRHFLSFSATNYDLLIRGISEYPGICLKGYSQAPVFMGSIYILTDRQTASTCEPIVYALQQQHLATIVGQKTAGAMLNGESFPVRNDGFRITIPTATFYTADGFRIDQQGVTPDIVLKEEDALAYVLNKIKSSTVHD